LLISAPKARKLGRLFVDTAEEGQIAEFAAGGDLRSVSSMMTMLEPVLDIGW